MSTVSKRYQTDDAFREVANLLFGGGEDELVSKMNPSPSDVATRAAQKKKDSSERTQAQIGLASNAIGLAAGVAGTRDAYKGYKASKLPGGVEPPKRKIKYENGKLSRIKPGKLARAGANFKPSTKMLAGGALALQVTNVAGDAVANRVLARAAKKDDVKKSIKEIEENASFPSKGKLTRASITSVARAHGNGSLKVSAGKFKKLPDKVQTKNVKKSADLDVVWEGEISKVNADKQQVFGWASIVEMNGEPVVDLQGDYITIDEVEKSAYDYVHKSRKGGDMHLRDGDQPVHASDMIESMVMTPDKKKALGMPEDTPTGWWVGYQVNDPEVWAKVKSGERTGFSIHGRGVRS